LKKVSDSLEDEFINRVMASQGIVHKVCNMYCINEDERKDLFQEIMIQLWKSYPSFRGDAEFSTWMYRVALNVALQKLRNEEKSKEYSLLSEHIKNLPQENKNDDLAVEKKLLYRAIKELNDVEKAIVMLYLEEKGNEEIAEIMGITQNYVRVKMTRIRTKLKNLVEA